MNVSITITNTNTNTDTNTNRPPQPPQPPQLPNVQRVQPRVQPRVQSRVQPKPEKYKQPGSALKAVLVSSNEDIVICANFCKKCFEDKLGIEVLKVYDTTKAGAHEFISLGCRAVNIKSCSHQ